MRTPCRPRPPSVSTGWRGQISEAASNYTGGYAETQMNHLRAQIKELTEVAKL